MSIYAYTGLPGSGKSYDVVANQVMPALKSGRHVVTNIPLELSVIRELIPEANITEFPMEQVQASPELIDQWAAPGCVLVLDEVWRLWPSGQKAHQVPEPFRKLLAEHRHMVNEAGDSMQIVLVTQDLAQIGAFARQLVENTFHHTKLTHVGSSGSYRVDVYQGPMSGPNPPRQQRLREVFGRYDDAIFKLYRSHTMSRSSKSGANEKAVDPRVNIWRRPGIYVGLAFVIVAAVWGIPQLGKAMHPGADRLPSPPASPAPAPAAARPSSSTSGPRHAEGGWRIVGRLQLGKRHEVTVTDGRVWVRLPFDRYCMHSVDGWEVCRWEGQEITPWSATRYVEPVRRAEVPKAPEAPGIAPGA